MESSIESSKEKEDTKSTGINRIYFTKEIAIRLRARRNLEVL